MVPNPKSAIRDPQLEPPAFWPVGPSEVVFLTHGTPDAKGHTRYTMLWNVPEALVCSAHREHIPTKAARITERGQTVRIVTGPVSKCPTL